MKKEPIRVAQIIGKWVGGGVESVIMNYYRHIDKNQVQFDFICDEDSTNIPYEEIKSLGGNVILVPPYQQILKYIKNLKKIFKENKYDIVHSNINTLSVFPLYAAYKSGIKVRIAHSHSTSNKKEWKKNIIKNILRPFSKRYATHYFACSELAGRYLFGNKCYDEGKVVIINNAIEIDNFKYNERIRKETRKKLNINEDTFVIGHIGRFVQQKNHEFLIDVFKDFHATKNNSLLLLIGSGPLEQRIKNKVEKYNLTNNVMFLGQRNDVNDLYQAMDLFLLPSLYEGLGMVLIEAQASGIQCIASTEVPKTANISNIITFADLKDKNKWINIIRNIKLSNRSQENKNIVESEYNIHKENIKLCNIYKSTIKLKDK